MTPRLIGLCNAKYSTYHFKSRWNRIDGCNSPGGKKFTIDHQFCTTFKCWILCFKYSHTMIWGFDLLTLQRKQEDTITQNDQMIKRHTWDVNQEGAPYYDECGSHTKTDAPK
jgi:hypothetical protein